MKYQLVLQWPQSALRDFDSMVEIEDCLIKGLSAQHDVDGHDVGAGEVNIFIHTDDPISAFDEVKKSLMERAEWPLVRVAYRDMSKGVFKIVWPNNLTTFNIS